VIAKMAKPSLSSVRRRIPSNAGQPLTLQQAEARTRQFPNDPAAWKQLGRHLREDGRIDEAVDALQKAVDLASEDPEAWILLGQAEAKAGNDPVAQQHFERALELRDDAWEAHQGIADVLHRRYDNEGALVHLDRVLELRPNDVPALSRKAQLLTRLARLDEAAVLCQQLIRQDSKNSFVHWNDLGNINRDLGLLDEAERCYSKAATFGKTDPTALSNRLTLLHYMPDRGPLDILHACKEWSARFAPTKAVVRPVPSDRSPHRKLRLGMFSDGFRQHPVGAMTTPALEHLVNMGVEIYAYSTSNMIDSVTRRLMAIATKWTPIATIDNEGLAQRIREDGIDILMDLSGHNAGNRIRTMTLQPAPLLMKWVGGLINTTGVEAIDYLLSDAIESPPGSDAFYTEKLIRMPDDYICYMPPRRVPDVGALPALRNGHITFGCFNNPTKINETVLAQWARILHAVPGSHLFLKGGSFGNTQLRQRTRDILEGHGVSPERIRIEGQSPHYELFQRYNEVDIALDPWPYSGGLTTCEAMLMGVPVITLPGPTFAGRHSATHLVNAGMPELVTNDWDEYLTRAVGLAADLDSLATIRSHLREILLKSPVCDGRRFARNLANALRAIWQRYCDGKPPAALSFTEEGRPWFEGDDAPLALTHPDPEPQTDHDDFNFSLQSKVITLVHGGSLVESDAFAELTQLGAMNVIALDPPGQISNVDRLRREGRLQHYHAQVTLGDGEAATLHACLDASLSGTLAPLATEAQLPFMASAARVLAKLPVKTIRLDEIQGLEKIDWLVLNETNDNLKVLNGAERLLPEMLLLQVAVQFIPVYQQQPDLGALTRVLADHGFQFLRLVAVRERSYYPETKAHEQRPGSQLLGADAIFIPGEHRMKAMDAARRVKLAFILHTAYRCVDAAYHVLRSVDEAVAERYLQSNDNLPASLQNGRRLATLAPRTATPRAEPAAKPIQAPPSAVALPAHGRAKEPDSDAIAKMAESISAVPHMEAEGRALLSSHLARSKIFLEYGSGGSSVMAANTAVRHIYSVDSDLLFLRGVEARIERSGATPGKYVPIYVDIGPTGAWGVPQDRGYAAQWPRYISEPWTVMRQRQHTPDLILVDGRFRVASFLASALQAPAGCVILFDDYFDRPQYHIVEEYLKPTRSAGRMAEFVVTEDRAPGLIEELLKYSTNPA
jgi:predicted O-linked N-acetylglucosamine transferase (SPINDLY family)